MSTAAIHFSCPQCQKKFSTPGTLAGKTVKCSCGTPVTVPSPQSAAAPPQPYGTSPAPISTPAPQPVTPSSYGGQTASSSSSVPASSSMTGFSSGGFGGAGATTTRRDFPALKYVAKCIDVISWLYVIGGMIAAVGVVAAAGPEAFPFSLLGGILVGLIVLLIAVFIRASAELIRLGLYIAELLEDIRSNTG